LFVQVIRGKVKDPSAMQGRLDAWKRDLGPGAKGWLGATMGTTDDGTYINVVRFESEDAAKANSERPEQGQWWQETEKLFDGPVAFYNCPRVEVFRDGGSDQAGFVQVMVFKPSDVDKIVALNKEFEKVADQRPDILGGVQAIATDGTVIDTNYFTSEAAARQGESMDMPPEMQKTFAEFQKVAGDTEFIDLKNPTLMSP